MRQDLERYREIADGEVTKPDLLWTEWFLSVHKIKIKEGTPEVAFADITNEGNLVYYYAIEDNPYHLAIIVEPSSSKILYSEVAPYILTSFGALSSELDARELLEITQIQPTKYWQKGTPKLRSARSPLHKNSGFYCRVLEYPFLSLEDKLAALLDYMQGYLPALRRLPTGTDVMIRISYVGYRDITQVFDINTDLMKSLHDTGIPICLEVRLTGPLHPDEQ